MSRASNRFRDRYGPWAVVAGASEGLGAAFATALARRGLNLLLLARRQEALDDVARTIREGVGVQVRTLALDVGSPDAGARLDAEAADLEIGLLVYNAAYSPIGAFVETAESDLLQAVDVNVRGPLVLLRRLVPPMAGRGRGGVVLMSSLSGQQGGPRIATYAGTKAFNTILGEGLWSELRPLGVDVVASCAGAIRTPAYARSAAKDAPGTLDPEEVVRQTLHALGRSPRTIPGLVNRLANFTMQRLLPRRAAIGLMAANTRDLR